MITSLRNILFILLVVCCLPLYTAQPEDATEFEHEDFERQEHEQTEEQLPTAPHQEEMHAQQQAVETPQQELAHEQAVMQEDEKHMQQEAAKDKPAPQQQEPHDEEDEEIAGINTVDLKEPQGNWLFKRIWFERAEREYEKAVSLSQLVMDSRMDFFQRRSSLDKDVLDPFYLSIGLGQGELQEIVDVLSKKIEAEREREGDLDAQEREFLDTLQKEKELLRQIGLDVTFINDLDRKIDEDLHVLMEQINLIRNYENEAWQNFKEISRTLSDRRAREIFIEMKNTVSNITEVYKYIGSEFHDYFIGQLDVINNKINQVKAAIQELKNKGIDLKTHFEQLVVQREAQERGEQPVIEEEVEEEPEAQPGFFTAYIINPISALGSSLLTGGKVVWDGLAYVISWPFKKIMRMWQAPEKADEDVDYQFLDSASQELADAGEHDFIDDHNEVEPDEHEHEINPEQDHEGDQEQERVHVEKDEVDLDALLVPAAVPVPDLSSATH